MRRGNAIIFLIFFIGVVSFWVFTHGDGEHVGKMADIGCRNNSFTCYAQYYRALAASRGVATAISDLKTRTTFDSYTKKECHLLMHEVGRRAMSGDVPLAMLLADGDEFCGNGYHHGVLEGIIAKHGKKEISSLFLNSLCSPLKKEKMTIEYQHCAHGIGHGFMNLHNNELLEALDSCNLFDDKDGRFFCWTGVFMENVFTDFRGHTTKYLKPEEPMYPCTEVEERYKGACYVYQSSYVHRITGSFDATFAACKNIPATYQNLCYEGIGREAVVEMVGKNYSEIREDCLRGTTSREKERCVIGAATTIITSNQFDDESLFCSSFSDQLSSVCFSTVDNYNRTYANPKILVK